jgi:C-terminal processing protease CtpA/Prc
LHFRQLSERTNYLKIPSFDLSFKNKIDSLIIKNRLAITSKENLIIDLRNNGGGGFDAFQSILPYVLDTNLTEAPYYGSVWVSNENYAYYDRTKYEYTETKQDSIDELKYVEFLKTNIGRFTPIERSTDTIQLERNSPLNIAIMFNRNTASTAEGFILQASESKKVQTYGENSAGAVSYGDWMPVELPDLNIWVAITTKKMVFKSNEDFESIGISPDKDLKYTNENEWLKIILEQIEK